MFSFKQIAFHVSSSGMTSFSRRQFSNEFLSLQYNKHNYLSCSLKFIIFLRKNPTAVIGVSAAKSQLADHIFIIVFVFSILYLFSR